MGQDYTGEEVTVQNFFAVLLGDRSLLKGGSGKVVESKPNDRIFVYYSDHGGQGVLGEFKIFLKRVIRKCEWNWSFRNQWM